MNKIKFYMVAFLLLLPVIFLTMPATASEGEATFEKDNGVYRIRIEASQWEFKAFDLNADPQKEFKHRIEFPDATVGDKLEFELVSRDVQHGFSINELEIAKAMNRPEAGSEFGAPSIVEATLTAPELGDSNENVGVTYSAFCHIFCGLGHPDMKIKLVLGGGAVEFGPIVFAGALVINGIIFALTIRSIVTKITVLPEATA